MHDGVPNESPIMRARAERVREAGYILVLVIVVFGVVIFLATH
jgi:hypothetical protein